MKTLLQPMGMSRAAMSELREALHIRPIAEMQAAAEAFARSARDAKVRAHANAPGPTPPLKTSIASRDFHKAEVYGTAYQLGSAVHFEERADGPKWLVLDQDCEFETAPDCTLQTDHDAPFTVLGTGVTFTKFGNELIFRSTSIFKNGLTTEWLAHVRQFGSAGWTCSLNVNTLEHHYETRFGRSVDVVTRARIDHLALIAPWENLNPWTPEARSAGTSVYFDLF